MKQLFRILFILLVVFCFFAFYQSGFNEYFSVKNIDSVKSRFLEMGYMAPVYMTLFFIFLNITGIPRVFFTIFSGYVFGIFYGFIYSWIATMVGLIVTFILVRYLFYQSFEKRFGSKKMVEKMNRKIDQYGFWSVVFLRVIYVVPSSVLNYTFGFTKISTARYIYGSAIGFVPVVLLNVWAGKVISQRIHQPFDFNYRYIIIGVLLVALFFGLKALALKNRG
ncbi:MAG: VTT domain-containing protein [Bacteroidales bacterium]